MFNNDQLTVRLFYPSTDSDPFYYINNVPFFCDEVYWDNNATEFDIARRMGMTFLEYTDYLEKNFNAVYNPYYCVMTFSTMAEAEIAKEWAESAIVMHKLVG